MIKSFNKFIIRTPLFSLDLFRELTSERIISDISLLKVCQNNVFKEAIYLGSPALCLELEKWERGEIESIEKNEKLKNALLKYLSRITSRCTPYGLFAGCSLGTLSNKTNIKLKDIKSHSRKTRLDMNYLVALSQELVSIKEIRDNIKFYPNTSLYKAGEQYRYIEYYYKNGSRYHDIVAVDVSEYLDKILFKSENGAEISDLIELITDEDIDSIMAYDFIEELIMNQILISEFEPIITGKDFFEHIIELLERKLISNDLLLSLKSLKMHLEDLDKKIGNETIIYENIYSIIEKTNINFDTRYIIQTDMKISYESAELDKKVIEDVKKALNLLNKLTIKKSKTNLEKFKDAFYERYEEREMPLSIVLDTELGIGYGNNTYTRDLNPLIDDLALKSKETESSLNSKLTIVDFIINEKIIQCIKNSEYVMKLTDEDFQDLESNWDDLPRTMSFIIQMFYDEENKMKVRLNGGGGSSAANLLARFSHIDQEINDYVYTISEFEKETYLDFIIAEITHLPEDRVGNILIRPELRDYEIPYLASPVNKNIIGINDLMISLKNGSLYLRSKKHNKKVIPMLTNAHNYSFNSLPIYQFLADMQFSNLRSGVWLDISNAFRGYEFMPRIEYNNVVIQNASWNFGIETIKKIKSFINSKDLEEYIVELRKELKIPNLVTLVDGDNELLINLENITSVRMLVDTVKSRDFFKISEFLFDKRNLIVKDGEGNGYTNEIILSFYKN